MTTKDWYAFWIAGRKVLVRGEGDGIRATKELADLLGIELYRPYQTGDWGKIKLTDRHKVVLSMLCGPHKMTILNALRARKGVPDEAVE